MAQAQENEANAAYLRNGGTAAATGAAAFNLGGSAGAIY